MRTAEKDSDGNIISEKYLPKFEMGALTFEGWEAFFCDFNVENLTANDIVNINLAPKSHTNGILCGLSPTIEISSEYYILKGASNGNSESLGNVNK